MQRTFAFGLIAAVLFMGAAQAGTTLWGVTNGTGDAGSWTGGEIFTVDTGTGAVSNKAAYSYTGLSNEVRGFGDIAVRNNGEVYVTYYSDATGNFYTLAKVNTGTWAFDWTQTLPTHMNSLTFVGDTLYGHAGGGAVDGLYSFSALDGVTAPTFVGNSGYLGSDGDLAYNDATGKLYNVYTPNSTGNLAEINIATGAATLVGTLNGTAKFGDTAGDQTYGWAGLDFADGQFWAGTFWDQNLYTRSGVGSNPPDGVSIAYDLSASLGGNITGLDSQAIPEPVSMIFFGTGLVGVAGLVTRRRMRKEA